MRRVDGGDFNTLHNGIITKARKRYQFFSDCEWPNLQGYVTRVGMSACSDHISNAKTITLKEAPVKILGFFSKNHGGIFTHMGSMTHLHILDNNGHSGHVDEIALDSKAMLLFPH